MLLQRVGAVAQQTGTVGDGSFAPNFIAVCACLVSAGGQFGIKLRHRRDAGAVEGGLQRGALGGDFQVEPGAVLAAAKQGWRQDEGRLWLQPQRRHQNFFHTHRLVGQLVHKRRVRAVLQQAAHQVGQQVAVLAHRGVDATADERVLQYLAVHTLAHAVQALQLERVAALSGQVQDGGNGGGVVGGELRVDHIRCIQQGLGAGQVGHVGVVFVGEHGVMRQAQLLGAFDFRVPVRTFDQAAHQAQLVFAADMGDVFDEFQRPGLVRLHRQTKPAPLRLVLRHQRGQRLEHVERQLQAVHLFSVDGQVDVGAGGLFTQTPDTRHQLGQDTFALGPFVARVQRTEFDGNTVVLLCRIRFTCAGSYGFNSILVTLQVVQRIGIGACALAQHVVAVGELGLLFAGRGGLVHGGPNGLAQHKLAAQQLHGAHGGGHDRFGTELGQQALRRFGIGQKLFRQGNGAAGQLGQGGAAQHGGSAGVVHAVKVGPAQLVGGEGDSGFGIGHAQQGFGQAHQGQAFGAGDGVFAQQAFHGPERRRVVTHGLHPGARRGAGRRPVQHPGQRLQTVGNDLGLGPVGGRQSGGHGVSVSKQ